MKEYFKRHNIYYRIQQLLILLVHLLLIWWIIFLLKNAGAMTTEDTFLQFLGIAIFGAFIIRGTAMWARHHYLKELKKDDSKK